MPKPKPSMDGVDEIADGLRWQRAGHRLRPLRPDREPAAAARGITGVDHRQRHRDDPGRRPSSASRSITATARDDRERFEMQIVGGIYAGRQLIRGNLAAVTGKKAPKENEDTTAPASQ
jgi:hypothetical protein